MTADIYPYRMGLSFVFIFCGAISLWLGFANDFISVPCLILFWPASIALYAYSASTRRSAFFGGWLISFSGGCAALYWLYLPVTEVGGLPLVSGYLCVMLIAACLAVQGGCFALLASAFMGGLADQASHTFQSSLSKVLLPVNYGFIICFFILLGTSFCWFLLETGFAILFGFPWLAIGGAISQWPLLIQAGDICGVWLVSSLWLLPCLGFCCALYFRNLRFAAAGVPVVLFLLCYSCFMLDYSPHFEDDAKIYSLFVEGNIDQNRKWEPVFQAWTLNLYLDLTEQGLESAAKSDIHSPLVIWPETALPFFFERSTVLAEMLRKRLNLLNTPLLFGAPGVVEDKNGIAEGEVYNRAFLLTPNGKIAGFYDKEHLVPFGEYLPEWLNFDFLESLLQGVGVYRKGTSASPLIYQNWSLGMLICYEGIFPWLARARTAAGANVLVDISNDGWFGETPAARQHLFHTVGRCVENNRWLLRSTNTGISAVIDNRGRIRQAGGQFERGWILAEAFLSERSTVYAKIALWLPYAVVALVIFLFMAVKMRKA